jgi:hypothetical protein
VTHVVFLPSGIFFFFLLLALAFCPFFFGVVFFSNTSTAQMASSTNPTALVASSPNNTPISTETNTPLPTENQATYNPSPTSLSSFAQSISKLTKTNFLFWEHQIETYLQGHYLYGFVDGTKTPPYPDTSTSADGSLTISNDLVML